jgi:proteasome lid subunit RPN8/RPN11
VIHIPAHCLSTIRAVAEAAYPQECCGLLIGRDGGAGDILVTAVEPSTNRAAGDRRDSLEVDPQLRFDVMRRLDASSAKSGASVRIVGHYHSHPDHPALPSARDLEMAYEPDMIWVVVAVEGGRATDIQAHRLDEAAGRFREIALFADGRSKTTIRDTEKE